MRKFLLLLALLCLQKALHAQTPYVYTIKADSVKITNTCDTAELIIENHTQNVPGFLFNKGRGRTEFRRPLSKVSDSIYLVGLDTLKLSNAWLQGGNTFGTTGYFGTRDNNHIDFYTNNTQRMRLTNAGNLLLGTTTNDGNTLQVNGRISLINREVAEIQTPRFPILIGDESTGGGTGFLFDGDASGRSLRIGTGHSNHLHKFYIQTAGQPGDTIANYNFTYDGNISHALNIYSLTEGQTKLLLTSPGNLLLGTTTDNGDKLQVQGNATVNGKLHAGANSFIGVADTPSIGGSTQALKLYGNFQVVTAVKEGQTGGFTIKNIDWARPGATEMTLNGVAVVAYDNKMYFGGPNSGYFGVNTNGYNGTAGGPFSRTKFTLGNDSDPGSWNDSHASFGVSSETEFSTISNYPSLANYYYLETKLSSPVVAANTGQVGVRAPLKIGARQLWFFTGNLDPGTEAARITETGHVLIGSTTDNGSKFQVEGGTSLNGALSTTGTVRFSGLTNDSSQTRIVVCDTYGNLFYRNASSLAINSFMPSDLAINGTVSAQKMLVTQTGRWPDYVFNKKYQLPTLTEVENFIKQNNHLPGILSAAEVEKNGIDVSDNQAALLKKIEELTLYAIEQDKKLQKQSDEISELKKQSKELELMKQQITELKELIKAK